MALNWRFKYCYKMGTYINQIQKSCFYIVITFSLICYSFNGQSQSIKIEAEDTTKTKNKFLKQLGSLTTNLANGTHLVLYRQSKKENEKPILFKVNGEKHAFLPYSELTIQTDSLENSVQICYDRKYQRCKTFDIKAGKKTYMKFSQIKKKAVTLKLVNEIDGENHSARAAAQQLKRKEAEENRE